MYLSDLPLTLVQFFGTSQYYGDPFVNGKKINLNDILGYDSKMCSKIAIEYDTAMKKNPNDKLFAITTAFYNVKGDAICTNVKGKILYAAFGGVC